MIRPYILRAWEPGRTIVIRQPRGMANMTGKTDAEGAFGPIDMKGPGVDAWNAILEHNDSEDAEILQAIWAKREQVRNTFASGQKELFEQLAERPRKG